MKTLLFLLFALTLGTGVAHAQQKKTANNFTLTGHINGNQTDAIWFRYPDGNGKIIQQEVVVNNNSFVITGYISSPVNAEFAIEYFPNIREIRNYSGPLFIGPGAITVTLNANDLSSAKITGSVMQDEWDKNELQKQPLFKAKDALDKEMWKLVSAGNTPENHKAHQLLLHKVEKLDEQLKQEDYNFMGAHPNSYLSAYLTRYYYISTKLSRDSVRMFYKTFTPAIKQSIAGVLLVNDLAGKKH